MDYATQGQASSALSAMNSDRGIAGSVQPVPNLAARLERAASDLMGQCNRIQEMLARVNGTPRATNPSQAGQEKIATMLPLAASIEAVEMGVKRLYELASSLEQVA